MDLFVFKASLVYLVSSMKARAMQRDPVSKQNKKTKEHNKKLPKK